VEKSPVQTGEILAGKYRVERLLGVGGMGVVVAAHDVQLGRQVAVKFLLPEACLHAAAVERFLREARAAVRIQSEHVARVIEVGSLESGAPYMVMEYLKGHDLAQHLEQHGPLPIDTATDYLLQACEAIAEAHSLGIVHRDLKPGNLFLTHRADGSTLVKVLDFGISKALKTGLTDSADANLTATSSMMGSPLYMSPEQIRSAKDVDARTDIWALGVILYELVSGKCPFVAESLAGVLAQIVADEPVPLRRVRPDAPESLEQVLLACLHKDRTLRIQDVAQLGRELLPFAPPGAKLSVDRISRVLGVQVPPSAVPKVISVSAPALTNKAVGTESEWSRTSPEALVVPTRSSTPLFVGGGVLLALVGGLMLLRPATPSDLPESDPATASGAASNTPPNSAPPLVKVEPPKPVISLEPVSVEPVAERPQPSSTTTTATASAQKPPATKPPPTKMPTAVITKATSAPVQASPPKTLVKTSIKTAVKTPGTPKPAPTSVSSKPQAAKPAPGLGGRL